MKIKAEIEINEDELREIVAQEVNRLLTITPIIPPKSPSIDYYTDKGIHFVRIPVKMFNIRYFDKAKRAGTGNYFNLGFFAGGFREKEYIFTLPVANLICDINISEFSSRPYWKYLVEPGRKVESNKLYIPATHSASSEFKNKAVSTLCVYSDYSVQVEKLTTILGKSHLIYAISGIPLIVNGKDGKWYDCLVEGWSSGAMYGTWHTALAIDDAEPDYIYGLAFQTTSANMLNANGRSEIWEMLGPYGFTHVLKMDGGGSFYFKYNGVELGTPENRQINTIIQL